MRGNACQWLSAVARCGVLIFVAVLVVACGASSQPFQKDAATATGHTPPPVMITRLNGMPATAQKVLRESLAAAAARRDIAIVDGNMADMLMMAGDFAARADTTGNVRVYFAWVVTRADGKPVHRFSAEEVAGPVAGADPWKAVNGRALARIADVTAENLSTRLSQLGYATRTSGMAPPVDAYARAGPAAESELDMETFNGPVKTASITPAPAPAPAQALAVPREPAPAARQPAPRKANAAQPAARQPDNGVGKKTRTAGKATVIDSVAVIARSRGGEAELARAMRKVLKKAGWPVKARAGATALNVTPHLEVSRPVAGKQKVALVWRVAMPDGKVLGKIAQNNAVPAGALDDGWGVMATHAATAAAPAIAKLVDRMRGGR